MNNIVYFKNGGKQNSTATFQAVKEAIKTYKPEAIVIGTLSGQSALEAANILKGMKIRILAVHFQKSHWDKWGAPNKKIVDEAKSLGVEFIPNEPVVESMDHNKPDITAAWRVVSRGFKVGIQCASMAIDAGMIDEGSTVISIGGTKQGVDTAIIVQTFGYDNILKSDVKGIIAMPTNRLL